MSHNSLPAVKERKPSILITDTLFVMPEHEEVLRRAGFEIERLAKAKASTEELCTAIQGKSGYILGGVESVNAVVIAAADVLKAISFTGSGYTECIPAHTLATERGIAISAAVGGNASAVAEYALALMLSMIRRLPSLTTRGGTDFYVARGLSELTLGIVGFGHVGRKLAAIANALGMRVLASTRTSASSGPSYVEFVGLGELMTGADVVSLHVDKEHGKGVLGASELSLLKDEGIVVNAAFPEAVDLPALERHLKAARLFAAFDAPPKSGFVNLPVGHFISSNAQTAFNTHAANVAVSERVVKSMINLLTTGHDADLVNPEYRSFRKAGSV